jgi:hypothetical protein
MYFVQDLEAPCTGHIHFPGEKVIRRHNGRLVTERLRRPLLHHCDGESDTVEYGNWRKIGTLDEYRRRGRRGLHRLPIRLPELGYWCDTNDLYSKRGPRMMPGGYFDDGFGPRIEQREPAWAGNGGHGQGHGLENRFHDHHNEDRGNGQHLRDRRNYTTSDGQYGTVENRWPSYANRGGHYH